jgi:hypothetical protein
MMASKTERLGFFLSEISGFFLYSGYNAVRILGVLAAVFIVGAGVLSLRPGKQRLLGRAGREL